jgi:NAD(P)-dependent dehydrogenase (short-subunit alcohol dehydrogenase family)
MGERLQNKVAIVTGAGSSGSGWGNGKATAVLFAREGAKVLATDINLAAAEETKALIDQEGGRRTVCQA